MNTLYAAFDGLIRGCDPAGSTLGRLHHYQGKDYPPRFYGTIGELVHCSPGYNADRHSVTATPEERWAFATRQGEQWKFRRKIHHNAVSWAATGFGLWLNYQTFGVPQTIAVLLAFTDRVKLKQHFKS